MEESDRRKSKGTDEIIVVGCSQGSEKEHGFLLCEAGGHLKNTEEEQETRASQNVIAEEKNRLYVWSRRKRKTMSHNSWIKKENEEDMEELSLIPSALNEPRWTLHICDNKCRKEDFKFYQLVTVVTEEGGPTHTKNLCKT